MPSGFVARFDSRAQDRYLRKFRPDAVERIMDDAAKAGAKDAAAVMKAVAPIGTSDHPSQYYRAHGLGHGTFRATVRAAKIRGRSAAFTGIQGRTIGYVIGPIGKNAFTRYWIERATGWVADVADTALETARRGSEAVLELYERG